MDDLGRGRSGHPAHTALLADLRRLAGPDATIRIDAYGGSGRPHAYPRSACLHADPGASAGGLRLSAGNRARLRQLQCGVCWLGRLVWRWL